MIYEVTLTQRYYNQTAVNRWNYVSSGSAVGVTGAYALLSAMGAYPDGGTFPTGTLFKAFQVLQSEAVTFISVFAKAIREAPTDFYDYAYPTGVTGGNTASQAESPTLAYGFFTNRVRLDVARGTKRLVGVCEASTDNGGVLSADAQTGVNNIASLMSATLSYTDGGSSLTFQPAVCGKKKYVTPKGKDAYEYYPTIAQQLDHTAIGVVWTPYTVVRTQTSRQYGKGV